MTGSEVPVNRVYSWMLCLAACLAGFLLARQLPARDEQTAAVDRTREDFELMRLFAEAYEQIDMRYVKDVERRKLLDNAIRGMLTGLDPYSSWIPREDLPRFEQFLDQEFIGVGIQVHLVNGRSEILTSLPETPAWRAGIRTGDVLLEVDGKTINGLSPTDIGKLIAGPMGRPVSLQIRKAGTESSETIQLVRDKIQVPTVSGVVRNNDAQWTWLLNSEQGVGYIRLTHFSRNTADELKTALERLTELNARSLVLDLRSNPGGLIESAVDVADLFLDSGRIVSMQGRAVKERSWQATPGTMVPATMPIAILINRQSASASEILAAALQDHQRAVLIGERTFGKGSVQNVIKMDAGKSAMKLTTAGYLRPCGVNIHRFPDSRPEDDWGVRPDPEYLVDLTKEQFSEWQKLRESASGIGTPETLSSAIAADLQLKRAIEWALSPEAERSPEKSTEKTGEKTAEKPPENPAQNPAEGKSER